MKVQGLAKDVANAMDVLPIPPDVTSITTLSTDGSVYTGNYSLLVGRRMQSLDSNLGGDGGAHESSDMRSKERRLLLSTADTATAVASITAVTAAMNTLLASLQATATVALLKGTYFDWTTSTTQIAQVGY